MVSAEKAAKPDMENFLKDNFSPILGAVGIIGLLNGIFELPKLIVKIATAWESIVHPVIDLLFSNAFHILGIELTNNVSNYIGLSFVVAGAGARANLRAPIAFALFGIKPRRRTSELGSRSALKSLKRLSIFFPLLLLWPFFGVITPTAYALNLVRRDFYRSRQRVLTGDTHSSMLNLQFDLQAQNRESANKVIRRFAYYSSLSVIWAIVIICTGYVVSFGEGIGI